MHYDMVMVRENTMKRTFVAIAMAAGLGVAGSANAALVTYTGADNSVSSLAQMTNSAAAAASFLAAVPSASVIDFESALPTGVSIVGGSITSSSGCGPLCGINTTSGGRNFLSLFGGQATFNFATAINSFGAYITGLQTDIIVGQTLTFSDGSSQTVGVPNSINGGGAFIGFTDFGKSITSITYNASSSYGGDIIAIDDVRFGNGGGVPEPATWAMMILGFGAAGSMIRRRKAVVA